MIVLAQKNFDTIAFMRESWPRTSFVVIGATALAIRGHAPPRRSDDVDLAVAVEPEELSSLREALRPAGWEDVRRQPHRWRHYQLGLSADVVPAGANPGATSEVQLARGLVIDLRGLDVALAKAEDVAVICEGDESRMTTAPTPPLPVLMLLKMIAYVDKPTIREKDAADVGRVMLRYLGEDDERRWDPPQSTVYDEDLKGACALGADMHSFLSPAHRRLVELFMDSPIVRGELDRQAPFPNAGEGLVRAFYAGLEFRGPV